MLELCRSGYPNSSQQLRRVIPPTPYSFHAFRRFLVVPYCCPQTAVPDSRTMGLCWRQSLVSTLLLMLLLVPAQVQPKMRLGADVRMVVGRALRPNVQTIWLLMLRVRLPQILNKSLSSRALTTRSNFAKQILRDPYSLDESMGKRPKKHSEYYAVIRGFHLSVPTIFS